MRRKQFYINVFETLTEATTEATKEAEKIKNKNGIKIEINKIFTGDYLVTILAYEV